MSILNLFNKASEKYTVLDLKDGEDKNLLSLLPEKFRVCYISDEELMKSTTQSDILEAIQACIPDGGSIMAGEFGEIFSLHVLKDYYLPRKLIDIKKWIWKEGKNIIMRNTDVILLHRVKEQYTSGDLAVFAESKVKATKDKRNNPIQNSITGAKKDAVSRYVSTLVWLRDKYRRESNQSGIELVNRFLNTIDNPYERHFKAIAIVDKEFLDDEIEKTVEIPTLNDNLEIMVISISGLKLLYQEIYKNIPVSFKPYEQS